jgi:hypothetical protein
MLTIYNIIFSYSGYLQLPVWLQVPQMPLSPVSVFHLAPLELVVLELLLAMFLMLLLVDITVHFKHQQCLEKKNNFN